MFAFMRKGKLKTEVCELKADFCELEEKMKLKIEFCKLVADFCELTVCFHVKNKLKTEFCKLVADFCELKVCFAQRTHNISKRSNSGPALRP